MIRNSAALHATLARRRSGTNQESDAAEENADVFRSRQLLFSKTRNPGLYPKIAVPSE